MNRPGAGIGLVLLSLVLVLPGCTPGVETGYGRSRTSSINGTGTLAELFRQRGHTVRVALRLTDELREWAEVVVRFAPRPGPPEKEEARWYDEWLDGQSGRRVIYVPYDYNAGPDYWQRAKDQLPASAPARVHERVDAALLEAKGWANALPPPAKETAADNEWFAVKVPTRGKAKSPTHAPKVCKTLGGPWAEGVEAAEAAVVRDEVLKPARKESLLLTGDDEPLAVSWTRPSDSRVLVAASGTFLINGALAAREARWPLARRVVDWAGYSGDEDEGEPGEILPKRVAFVEGSSVTAGSRPSDSVFDLLLKEWTFRLVYAQFLVLGLAAALVRALTLRTLPRDDGPGGDRPVAHPEALGALLARTYQSREARSILENYRRWRFGTTPRAPAPAGGAEPPTAPGA